MKNNIPLVSIIVVCYNHEKYINECIYSVMHQSYTNIEVLVFDNGSTDNSPSILKDLQVKYKFKLIFQENIGAPKTLNIAVKMAQGKYISPISTDDFWPLDKIEICVDFMENCNNNIAMCGGTAIRIDENSNIFSKQTFAPYHEIDFHDVFLDGKIIPALTSLIRKDILLEVGLFDTNIRGEDYPMWLKITHKGYKIAYLNKLLGYYRFHSSNMSLCHAERLPVMKYCLEIYKDNERYKDAINNMYIREFNYYAQVDKKLALKFFPYIMFKKINKYFFIALLFLIMPYKIVKKITRTI